jgi:hypothetical protein
MIAANGVHRPRDGDPTRAFGDLALRRHEAARRDVDQHLVAEAERAARGALQARQRAQRHRLARARRPEEHQRAGGEREARLDGEARPPAGIRGGKLDAQVASERHGHRASMADPASGCLCLCRPRVSCSAQAR